MITRVVNGGIFLYKNVEINDGLLCLGEKKELRFKAHYKISHLKSPWKLQETYLVFVYNRQKVVHKK